MFRDGKLSFDIKQFFPTNGRQYTFTPVAASRAVSVIMVVGLMLPLPWFTLADGGQSIAGTRLLSYALDGFSSLSYIFSVSPVNAFLFFSLPIVIAVLSLMTLADSIMNKAVNVRGLSVLNIIAMLLLMYVAALIADPTQHAVFGGLFVLPKWGLWFLFLLAVALVLLSVKWTNLSHLRLPGNR